MRRHALSRVNRDEAKSFIERFRLLVLEIRQGGTRPKSTHIPGNLMNFPNHLRERTSIDIVEVAKDIDVLRRTAARSDQSGIVPQRLLIIGDADVVSLIKRRNVEVMFALICVDNTISGETCRAAVRMVNHNDILDSE